MAADVAAILAGATLYALALPPYDLSACGWLVLVPLLLAVRGRSAARAFAFGALYGSVSAWTVGWWIAQAGERYLRLGVAGAILAASVYALLCWGTAFGLFAAGATTLLRSGRRYVTAWALPALWVATELLRGRVIGQPWALLGYTQHARTGLIQVAAATGVYGVSYLVALGNAALADGIQRGRAGEGLRGVVRALVLPAVLIGTVWAGGVAIMEHGPAGGFAARRVAVVQTNLAPAFEWTRAYSERQVMAHLQATEQMAGSDAPALVVWPEHAVPRYLDSEPMLAAQLGTLAARHHTDLLFGAPRFEDGRTYNSVRLITAAGRNGGHYDKQRLVVFAEASPFADAVPAGPSDSPHRFSAGTAPGLLQSFVLLGVSICHEVLYPELIGRAVRGGAELLVNVSNDGWLDGGYGTASRQHFTMAVFRAVETRRYLVRAATTGVSGIVDPYGRVVDVLAPGASGVVSAPVAGRSALTPYVRLGDAFALACALAAATALVLGRAALPRRRSRLVSAPTAS